MLNGHGEQVALHRYGGAVVGAGVEDRRRVGSSVVLQLVLVDQRHVAGAVVVDGGPFSADIHMDGAVAGQVEPEAADVRLHQVEVVAMLFQVDAAVEDVGGVGVAGDGEGVASAVAGVDAAGAGTEVKFPLDGLLPIPVRSRTGRRFRRRRSAAGLPVQRRLLRRRGRRDGSLSGKGSSTSSWGSKPSDATT